MRGENRISLTMEKSRDREDIEGSRRGGPRPGKKSDPESSRVRPDPEVSHEGGSPGPGILGEARGKSEGAGPPHRACFWCRASWRPSAPARFSSLGTPVSCLTSPPCPAAAGWPPGGSGRPCRPYPLQPRTASRTPTWLLLAAPAFAARSGSARLGSGARSQPRRSLPPQASSPPPPPPRSWARPRHLPQAPTPGPAGVRATRR